MGEDGKGCRFAASPGGRGDGHNRSNGTGDQVVAEVVPDGTAMGSYGSNTLSAIQGAPATDRNNYVRTMRAAHFGPCGHFCEGGIGFNLFECLAGEASVFQAGHGPLNGWRCGHDNRIEYQKRANADRLYQFRERVDLPATDS